MAQFSLGGLSAEVFVKRRSRHISLQATLYLLGGRLAPKLLAKLSDEILAALRGSGMPAP